MIDALGLPERLLAPLWLLTSCVLAVAAVTPVDRLRASGIGNLPLMMVGRKDNLLLAGLFGRAASLMVSFVVPASHRASAASGSADPSPADAFPGLRRRGSAGLAGAAGYCRTPSGGREGATAWPGRRDREVRADYLLRSQHRRSARRSCGRRCLCRQSHGRLPDWIRRVLLWCMSSGAGRWRR